MSKSSRVIALMGLLAGIAASPSQAALDIGERAPTFTTPAAKAGQVFSYALAEHLAKGPVVLYFFPAAFTEGCSIEANEFAEATAKFEALGATVVGVSGDDIDTLSKFSVKACNGRFPVASDGNKAIMKSFDAVMQTRPDFANRVTYLIAPDGKIVYNYLSLNPARHVEKTLAALRDWKRQSGGGQ